ncbi:hypothetical protein GlitD10_1286 [Gloeomargarita lithophora Alchichica-D10]|uniref:PepSY domain-containing protein n=1 Tax=Gloeomargarita lithophora Alchichica-D10 TaxID=1188229 RepID=A0A1J0ACE3_9CYAN|nr:hypothetical protein [Gloeomargarita lithophora]APB33606.1 hypothetical protein GlitD10_1286 [Gloeomargarita lithophora Alchichica-D10]
MVRLVATLCFVSVISGMASAGTPVAIKEIPPAVSRSISNYFPGAKILRAERDTDDGQTTFEVKVRYKEINLKLDVNPQGKILDVDMVD